MKPIIPPQDHASAHDALFDQIERELALLTTASLDATDTRALRCVDEFANDFLNWNMPPQQRGRLPDR